MELLEANETNHLGLTAGIRIRIDDSSNHLVLAVRPPVSVPILVCDTTNFIDF
jgi:hypothetical protein